MTDFRDRVGDDLTPEEEVRLARVHELLVAAGAPPDLPPALAHPPAAPKRLLEVSKRRWAPALLLAAALAATAFGAGYLAGHRGTTGFVRVGSPIPMRGANGRLASIELGPKDAGGNWPMLLHVRGLDPQPSPRDYYELFLTKRGRPIASCGTFRVHAGTTTVVLNAPYKLERFQGWVIVTHRGGEARLGPTLLRTRTI